MTSPFQKLQDLPSYFCAYIPKPAVCQNNEGDDCIVIASDCDEGNAGIYRYQFKINELNLMHKYEGNILKPEFHGQCIDPQNQGCTNISKSDQKRDLKSAIWRKSGP